MKKKNIRILCLSILILTLCYLFLFKYSSKSEREIALLLGIEQVEIISFDYEEDWNHKDYDIIEIYKLSDNTITDFQINSTYVLCEEFYEKHLWMKLNWTKTPIELCKWHEIYNMVIEPIRVNDRHNEWILRIKSVINKSGNYYSLYHKDKNPIAMYILDTNDKILYCIYYKI